MTTDVGECEFDHHIEVLEITVKPGADHISTPYMKTYMSSITGSIT